MKSPVLFVVFNRPETTARVFQAIREAKPPRLYVAADGPRASRADDQQRCTEVRKIASSVDWPCELKTLYRDGNLGCKMGVSSAVNWFFEHEEEGIILEDDCLPAPTFFSYCDELLERYRDDTRIVQISGTTYIPHAAAGGNSYFFTHYPDIWGWATWRRTWRQYDVTMAAWKSVDRKELFRPITCGNNLVRRYWTPIFNDTQRGANDTWDFQFFFLCWKLGGINIMPTVNQIENLGYGDGATHTIHKKPAFVLPAESIPQPLIHPQCVEVATGVDEMIRRERYTFSHTMWLYRMVRSTPFGAFVVETAKKLLV